MIAEKENRAQLRTELSEKIEQLFSESNAEYRDVMQVLKRLVVIYQDKGTNLLDKKSIQEVQAMPRL